jgi:pilus assembly protein Flp/PilA
VTRRIAPEPEGDGDIGDGMPGYRPQSARGPLLCSRIVALFAKLAASDTGVTAIEYAFIAGLVAIVIVGAVTALGTSVSGLFGSLLTGF